MMVDVHQDARGVAHVRLNRPDKHNAFDERMIAELTEAFLNPAVTGARAVLLTGEGKSFCAGADADWMRRAAAWSEAENRADAMCLSNMLATIDCCPAPVIALVQGFCLGGGVGLVACADMVVAHPEATFGLSEVKLGITPATISPFVLRAIGARQARRLFLTGARFGSEEAQDLGLVHVVAEDMQVAADDWIAELMTAAPGAVSDAKQLVRDMAGRPIDDALRAETARRIAARRTTDEAREGMAAFLEKRKPDWVTS